jgi:hypothetical protein
MSPVPCPAAGERLATHATSLAAVHAHSGAVVTVTVPAPPDGSIVACATVNATEHLTGVGPVATFVVVELQPRMANAHARATASSVSGRTGG